MVENATKLLDTLPEDYKNFYMKRMIANLETKISTEDQGDPSQILESV
jgi:hypothetical protein